MFCGGDNNIHEGGKKNADAAVCDPTMHSCPDITTVDTTSACVLPPEEKTCVTEQPVSDASVYAPDADYPDGTSNVHMTSAQSLFFGESNTASSAPDPGSPHVVPDPELNPDDVLLSVVGHLTGTPPPKSAIERVSNWSPFDVFSVNPNLTSSAAKNNYDLLGPEIDGKEYAKTADEGMKALQEVWKYTQMTPEELANLSPHEQKKFEKAVKKYEAAARAIHGEGTSHGWTPSHTMESFVNSMYQIKAAHDKIAPLEAEIRAELEAKGTDPAKLEGEVARVLEERCAKKKLYNHYKLYKAHVKGGQIVMGHLNFGIPMTDLNKRDASGRLGDAVRDYVRELTNKHLGKVKGEPYDAKKMSDARTSADNVSAMKAMTYAVHGVSTAEAAEGLKRIQAELQSAIDSGKFKDRLPADMKDISLAGLEIQLKGYHFESKVNVADVTPKNRAAVHNVGMAVLGALSHGEDVASKVCKKKPTILVTEPLGEVGIMKATHALYGLFRSKSPGTDIVFEQGKAPSEMQLITEADLKGGSLLRPGHDFGYGLVHAKNIGKMHAELNWAIIAFGQARPGTQERREALARITAADKALKSYMLRPEIEVTGKDGAKRRVLVDPSNTPVLERMAKDYARSRNVYRFRTADGEGFVAIKRDHMGQVITERGKGYKGKQWLIGMELGKVGDYMKKFAAHDGIKDPVFAQLFDMVSHELGKRGFDVQMAVLGGDEFLLHVREKPGVQRTTAQLTRGVDETIGVFEGKHEPRSFVYSEKMSVPGGKWKLAHHNKGVQFGIHEGKIYFKKPKGSWLPHKAMAFKKQVGEVMADPQFRATVAENFGSVDLDKPKIVSGEEFAKKGETKRRDVWFVPANDKANHGELYLVAGDACKTKGAARPEKVLTAEAAVMRVDGARRLDTAVSDLFDSIQDGKKSDTRVKLVKPRGPGHVVKSLGKESAIFMIAGLGSKFLINLGKAIARDDWSDLAEGIHVGEELEIFGAMTGGSVGTKAGVELIERRVAAKVAPGATKAFRTKYAGVRGSVLHGAALMGGLIAAEIKMTGTVDASNLGISLVNVTGAGLVVSVASKTAVARKGSLIVGGPVAAVIKMGAEFLFIEGLGYAEGQIMIAMERAERKDAYADALLEYDKAVSAAMSLDPASVDPENPPKELTNLSKTYAAVMETYGHCMEMEKYHAAGEFKPVEEAHEKIVDLTEKRDDAVEDLMDWDGHEMVTISKQQMWQFTPVSGIKPGMRIPRSRYLAALADRYNWDLTDAEDAFGSIVRNAEAEFKKNTAVKAVNSKGSDFDVPFAFEGGDVAPEKVAGCKPVGIPGESVEYRYSPAARKDLHTPICSEVYPDRRWHDAIPSNPHMLTVFMHFTLEKAQRALSGTGISARGDI